LIDNRSASNYFSVFYLRRVCRILPLYLAVLAALYAFEAAGIYETDARLIPLGYYLTFTQNFWIVIRNWYLSLEQSWSLAVEEQFYLTLPLLIWLTPRRYLAPILFGLAVAAPALRIVLVLWSTHPDPAVHVMLPFRMDAFLLGALAALALRIEKSREWLAGNGAALYAAFFALLAVVVFMLAKGYGLRTTPLMAYGYSILAALYTAFLLLSLRQGPIQRLCRLAWLRQVGIWAYGLYLLHGDIPEFLLRAAGAHGRIENGYDWGMFVLSMGPVFGITALSWRYFESPLIAWGHRAKYEATPKTPVLLSMSATE
jgi:peptidoglycan/LPS O-acetylase OafA/YrhL